MTLLTTGNTKTMKGERKGYKTYILHLAPSTLSGYNTCPMASKGCAAACLNTAGRGGMFRKGETTNNIQKARIRKTVQFFEDRDTFMSQLVKEVTNAIKYCNKHNLIPVFRLNGTSDIRWENIPVGGFANIMEMFPSVQFYDYTKLSNRRNIPANYHLTFSRSEENADILPNIAHNIAVVFTTKKGNDFPAEYLGRPVVDGDDTDLRFLDGVNVIVGLRAKGKAKAGTHDGFVVEV